VNLTTAQVTDKQVFYNAMPWLKKRKRNGNKLQWIIDGKLTLLFMFGRSLMSMDENNND
jgi:hypothetical protein